MTENEIETAIQAAFDGTLTAAECGDLREVLKADPAARALYFEHASIQQLLIYHFSPSQSLETEHSLANTCQQLQHRRYVRFAIAIAAVLVLALGLTLKLVLVPARTPLATFQADAGGRCTVEQDVSGGKAAANELRKNALVRLTQGSVEVTLRNGTRSIVLAPASFQIESEDRMKLHEGSAWFDVSKHGTGFQVTTPGMTVTDLGTQFGVTARPKAGDEVHVFSGRVIARSVTAPSIEETLTSGMARICDPAGQLQTMRIRPEDFLVQLPAHDGSHVIANGDFETGNKPADSRFGSEATSALLPAWNFGTNVKVALRDNTGRPGYGEHGTTVVSSTADVQVGFQNDTVGTPVESDVSIRQNFTTVPGTRYVVGFEMGAIFFKQTTIELTASVYDAADSGILLGRLVQQRNADEGNGYNSPARFTFMAESASTTLIFTETSPNTDDADPVIDNISVKAK